MEQFIFGLLSSHWLYFIVGTICLIGTYFSPLLKGVYKKSEIPMSEQSGCALVIAGFLMFGVAAILWKLS